MPTIERASYRAFLNPDAADGDVARAADRLRADAERLKTGSRVLTVCLTRYGRQLFLYVEHIVPEHPAHEAMAAITGFPDAQGWFSGLIRPYPQFGGDVDWAYMHPAFWSDEPKDVDSFRRAQEPDARCGRIAHFWPDTVVDYVLHHQLIVQEGLAMGDRYQFISVLDDVAFSYFETPRDRERVNIRREERESKEIQRWLDVDPFNHFDHFDPGTLERDFLIIDTLVSVG
ncbi:hypothetical protein [Bifidobacterium avesanii]|uniref:Uncharacterized protein n=1 Tax=Bifidobacterium avesanii TaxID=1798157 RepID=A0A7K3TJU0_9BIFI|nr:hypothetical protein [Bifidobacterium avesanii]KAB8292649.1 hypothetical protein DSM100685_0938 [Bifidobacterium avesanii]NEG78523.1 hypothetical protein [Bifidobacterium avesanii]